MAITSYKNIHISIFSGKKQEETIEQMIDIDDIYAKTIPISIRAGTGELNKYSFCHCKTLNFYLICTFKKSITIFWLSIFFKY